MLALFLTCKHPAIKVKPTSGIVSFRHAQSEAIGLALELKAVE